MKKNIKIKKIAQLTGHKAAVFAIDKGMSDLNFLSGAGDGWVVQWDINQPELGKLLAKIETNIFALLNLKAHEQLVVGNMNGGVHWIDLNKPEATKNILHHKKGVFDICLIKSWVLTIGGAGLLSKWSIPEKRAIESIQLSSKSLRSLTYFPALNELAIGASDQNIYFLDADSLELKGQIVNAHNNSVFAVKYSPDGQYLMSGGRDAHLRVWDLKNQNKLVSEQAAHMYTLNSIAFHPKAAIFATASRDRSIKIWDSHNFQLLKVIESVRDNGHLASVNKLYWTNFQNYLISASDDRSLIIWEIEVDAD